VGQKTVLIVDDEKGFVEPLEDALSYEGHKVLKASTAEEALSILARTAVNLVTIDIMMPQGKALEKTIPDSHRTGIYLCKTIKQKYPQIDIFCLSVISNTETIREIEAMGIRFLRKGEIPLGTVLTLISSKLTGIAYSTSWKDTNTRR